MDKTNIPDKPRYNYLASFNAPYWRVQFDIRMALELAEDYFSERELKLTLVRYQRLLELKSKHPEVYKKLEIGDSHRHIWKAARQDVRYGFMIHCNKIIVAGERRMARQQEELGR